MTEPKRHASCQHVAYRMSCDEYDLLRDYAGHSCQICGTNERRLVIDHDHSLAWEGIRGILCDKCNALMKRVDAGAVQDARAETYLANAWHLKRRSAT